MSDYNNGWGGCCGGIGEIIVLLIFFAFFQNGGMFGGNGSQGAAAMTAAETSQMIQQDNLRATAANTNAKLEWVADIVGSNAAKLETVKDAVTNGFFAEQTQMCQLGNNLNNAIRDSRELSQREFCDLRHQMQIDKCETLQAIAASKAEILGFMTQQELATLKAQNLELKGQLSQDNQTARIVAAIGAGKCCCDPCNACGDASVSNAITKAAIAKFVDSVFNPTTTPTTTSNTTT
jgi:hypothetical protein